MYLSSLELKNIRQFDHRAFKFKPGFNLLVGENGAGKTTLLRSMAAVLGSTRQTGRRPKLEDDDIRLYSDFAEVEAEVLFSNEQSQVFNYRKELWQPARPTRNSKDRPLVLVYASNEALSPGLRAKRVKTIRGSEDLGIRGSEKYLYQAEQEFARRRSTSSGSHFGDSYPVRDFVGRVLSTFSPDFYDFYWRFEPYDSALKLPQMEGQEPVLEPATQKLARSAALRYFQEGGAQWRKQPFDWPDQAKVILEPDASERDRYGKNLPNLSEIWKTVRLPTNAREILIESSLEVKLTPRIMIQRAIGPLSLSQLSDGEQRLFSLFVDIARQLSLQNPDGGIGEGEAIVLIDEIDVHLHPKWQRKIVPALEDLFQNCQFIATTHSPFVIQATNRQKVIDIDPESTSIGLDGGNSIEDIAEQVQGVNMPQRSVRAQKLSEAAKAYFTLLELRASGANRVTKKALVDAEKKYRQASKPFSSDPAVHALLELQVLKGQSS